MKETIKSAIQSRLSTGIFCSNSPVSDEKVIELINMATQAPSAFNMQNWKFIAVKSRDQKLKLKQAAFGQNQVEQAAVTFIVCGMLDGYKSLSDTLKPSVEQGIIDNKTASSWVKMAYQSHDNNPSLRRDEAIRSASLASMTLMLAAEGMGLSTGPIGGFDSKLVAKIFNLDEATLPVMLIAMGYPSQHNWSRKIRKKNDEVLEII